MRSEQAGPGRRVGAESKLQWPLHRAEHVVYTGLQQGHQGVSQQPCMLKPKQEAWHIVKITATSGESLGARGVKQDGP
jgi:hypothetical protein